MMTMLSLDRQEAIEENSRFSMGIWITGDLREVTKRLIEKVGGPKPPTFLWIGLFQPFRECEVGHSHSVG